MERMVPLPITIEQAQQRLLERLSPLDGELVPVRQAVGRILTRPVSAPLAQPPFDRSPLDGYAVRAADLAGASAEHPAVLTVTDTLFAGDESRVPVSPGQAVRLMTGAMLPAGADCVIRQEDTDRGTIQVQIFKALPSGANCIRRGEEYGPGDCLLAAGQRVDPAAAAVAAGAGLTALPVRRRPRAAVLATGDEVCPPGQPLTPGKIHDANTAYLTARLDQLGVDCRAEAVGDDEAALAAALTRLGREADLVVTTGGVSVGQKDFLETVLRHLGAELLFHGIAMKPGMPTLCALREGTVFLCLSGNPFSAAVAFELLAPPALAVLAEDPALLPVRTTARAAADIEKAGTPRRFLRATCRGGVVTAPGSQANGQMRSMVGCNCLVDMAEGTVCIRKDEPVSVVLFAGGKTPWSLER